MQNRVAIAQPKPGINDSSITLMASRWAASADVPMKGLVPLLEAVAKVRTEREAELVVIGRPRPESRAEATIDRLGLKGAVRFVSGVADEDIVRLYAEAEVAVVPSLYEGFSLPAVEAMACGTPVVAAPEPAMQEVAGDAAIFTEDLAEGVRRALVERERLSAAGLERAKKFSWRETARMTADVYRSVLDA